MDDKQRGGAAFAAARKARRMTLKQVGAAVGAHWTSPHKWQTRGIPPERVLALAKLLRLKPHDLRPDLYPPPTKRGAR